MMLTEDTRNTLVNKSKNAGPYKNQSRGKNRFARKKYSKIATQVKDYNKIDMDTFFKKDSLLIDIPVSGETSNYIVTLRFDGVLKELQNAIKRNQNRLEYKTILLAITKVFNTTDIFVKCTCADFLYRFDHWSIVNNYSVNTSAEDPGPGKGIVNPNNNLGIGCKHILLVLANGDWILKVASVINNYIHYVEEHLTKQFLVLIFPKLYGMSAEQALEDELFEDEKFLKTSSGLIDEINEYGKNRGKFKKGSNKNPVTQKNN